MFCQRCGNQLAPGARFCNACGTPVTAAAAPVSMARPALVTVLAVLHFIGGPFMLLGAIGAFTSAESSRQSDRFFALGAGGALLLLGIASLAAGIGLWKMREWGRILQIIFACFGLIGIPLGTIIAILLLVYFTRPNIKLLFSGRRLDQLAPEEIAALSAAGGGGAGGASAVLIAVVLAFVMIGIVGILAAIAIPNLLTAMQRSRQMRTMADMRRIAQSVETYRSEHDNAPPATIEPAKDAWTNKLRYASDGTNYWIVSAGKDGQFEENDVSRYTRGATTNFDADIVLENGEMLRCPERRATP